MGRGGITSGFLISTLDGGEWSALCPCSGERACIIYWIGGSVGPRASKIGMCPQVLVRFHYIRFHDHLFSASCVVTYGQTDQCRHDEASIFETSFANLPEMLNIFSVE
jgi:hypothetical protein